MIINRCRYCNCRADVVEIPFDNEFNFGPGGFSDFCVKCNSCGMEGPKVSVIDLPIPKVIRRYTAYLGGFPVPVEDYEPQDSDAEIRRMAINAWNSLN